MAWSRHGHVLLFSKEFLKLLTVSVVMVNEVRKTNRKTESNKTVPFSVMTVVPLNLSDVHFLRDHSADIAKFLKIIFQQSYNTGDLPQDWLTANVIPIFKKGKKNDASNYRPVSLTAVTCKLLEHIIHTHILKHCDSQNIIQNCQHGFRRKHSCESQLIITTEELKRSIDQKKQVDIIILDFSKAFDTVAHNKLISKLQNYGIQGKTNKWISKWLKTRNQKVVIDGEMSESVPVISGVPQGTVLGPLMFLLYINDINQDITSN